MDESDGNLPELARVAELVDARVSKTRSLWECRFDPGPGYFLLPGIPPNRGRAMAGVDVVVRGPSSDHTNLSSCPFG